MDLSSILSKDFLEKYLSKEVTNFYVSAGSKPGDNFMSCLYCVEVMSGDPEVTEHFLLKTYPKNEACISFLTQTNFFYKEIAFYTTLVPELNRFIQERAGENAFDFQFPNVIAGKSVNWWDTPYEKEAEIRLEDNFLLMTDVRKTHGFQMASRQEGFDVAQLKLLMSEIAKLHATSWAFKNSRQIELMSEEYPFLIDTLVDQETKCLNTKHCIVEAMKTVIVPSLEIMKKGFEDGENSPVFQAAQKLCGDADAAVRKAFAFIRPEGINELKVESWLRVPPEPIEDYTSDPWLVTIHGDAWINNTMFTYDEAGIPSKILLVDLQLVGEACPTVEFARIFFTSVKPEIRRRHLPELLQLYHDEFLRYCQLLNSPPLPAFNMETLRRRYRRLQIDGFILTLSLLNLSLSPPHDPAAAPHKPPKDIIEVMRNITKANMDNEVLIERLCETAKELYEDGVI